MKQIDWSKAPEGATHYQPQQQAFYADMGCEKWMIWARNLSGLLCWQPSTGSVRDCLIPAPSEAAWTGEGLPPVGTVCEVMDDAGCWRRAEVRMHGIDRGREIAICQADDVMLWCRDGVHCRPLRTPEQLAAAERDRIIHQMLDDLNPVGHTPGYTYQLVNCLYDAGYRKAGGAA